MPATHTVLFRIQTLSCIHSLPPIHPLGKGSRPFQARPPEGFPINYSKLFFIASLAFAPTLCLAQQPSSSRPEEALDAPAPHALSTTATIVQPNVQESLTGRWLDLDTLSHSERYRNAFADGGGHVFEGGQQRSLVVGKLKLDPAGRYDIGFRASSGRYFNWAYGGYTGQDFITRVNEAQNRFSLAARFGLVQSIFADPAGAALGKVDIHSNGWQFYLRELYFSATPVKAVTVEFGSFGIERGLSTEITTFDEDGYLSGERIRLHDAKHLFFDEVGFTSAYFGDIGTPNLFDRGSSLKKSNYRQVFARKQLNRRVGFSGEYTWQAGENTGIDTLRQAVVVGTKESKIFDSLRFEAYERLNATTFPGVAMSPVGPVAPLSVGGASGYAVTAGKKLGNFSGDIGYASIDKNYSVYTGYRFFQAVSFPLNGDAYGEGNRPFIHASCKDCAWRNRLRLLHPQSRRRKPADAQPAGPQRRDHLRPQSSHRHQQENHVNPPHGREAAGPGGPPFRVRRQIESPRQLCPTLVAKGYTGPDLNRL